MGIFSKKKPKKSRTPVIDVSAVKVGVGTEAKYVTARSYAEIVDLISEGPIEGITSGNYIYTRNDNVTGYQKVEFEAYTATGVDPDDATQKKELGFLRSVYWNKVPVVDKNGFYNFADINVNYVKGNPTGGIPTPNDFLPNYGTIDSSDQMDLTIDRSIGERLYGPAIQGGEDDLPTDTRYAKIKGPADKYAKTYRILNKECSKIIVRVKIPNLQENLQFGQKSYKKRPAAVGFGDQKARIIRYSIFYQPIFNERFSSNKTSSDVRIDFSADEWKLAKKEEVEGKIEQGYVRSSTIDLTDKGFQDKNNFEGWRIRIVRTTPESVTSFLRNQSFVDSIVEVYGTKMRYPYTSMVYSIFDARSFQRLPSRAYDAKLLKVKVPNNYNPLLKSYGNSSESMTTKVQGIAVGAATNSDTTDGVIWTRKNENATVEWDGNFAEDLIWTDNPAWCFYDLITSPRYGLGEFVDASQIDKWALYEIARYCDELVDDTYGGFEPRFTINYIITSREEAFKVLNDLSSIFRGLAYYSNGSIFSSQDKLKSSNYSFNNSNVIDGNFTYSSSAKRARHTVAIVRYNDKRNWYQPAVEYMEDEEHVKRYGIRELETTALGCTSRGQARRFAKWILASESEETETASFNVGMDGAYLRPGDVITIYDNHRNPLKYSGRTNAVVKGNTDLTVVNKLDGVPLTSLQRLNVNGVIIDQALNFQAGKKYKFSMLTPTYSYEQNTVETSNDVKDGVRRTQIQNLAFDGSDVINITGEPGTFRSDLRYQGSGVCTKIYFNSGIRIEDLDGVPKGNVGASPYTGNQLNFVDYVITGYSNNAVENSSAEVPYSGNYYSGQNLIWSIEPLFSDDPEFINNQESPYRIINITEEDDSSYGISSLSYSTGKYEAVDSIGNSYSNTLLDLFFPLPKVGSDNVLANWVGRYPNQLFNPSSTQNETNTEVLSAKQDTPTVGIGVTSNSQGLVSLKSTFSVAGFQNNLNIGDDAQTVTVNYPDDSSIDDKISYSYLISSTDPEITYVWNTNGTRSQTSVTPQENVTYAVDKEFYKDVKQNQIKLITAEDTKYFNSPGQKSKLEVETLITDPGDYYVMVYPISDIGVIGHGLLRKVKIEGDRLSTPIDTLTISNLTTRGPDGQPIQTTASSVRGFSLDNTEPTFLWEVGSQEEIFNRPTSEDSPNGFGRYEMNFDFVEDINYRVTIRKQSESNTPNLPSNYIYFEFTGYTSPSTTPAFAFDQQINNPDLIEDLNNADYTTNPNSRDITEYPLEKDEDKPATFYKVSPSGMVIRNTQDLPLREFDIVVETQDNAGNTSNNNKVYANTIDTDISEEFNVEDFNSSYDILGVSIDSPEGVFFAQDTVSTEEATVYYKMQDVAINNYPYKATLRLMSAGTLDLTMEDVENADGTTSTTEEQADRFSDDIQGVVYYFTTGDHTKNADGEYKNLAPEFKVNINEQRQDQDDKTVYNIKSNENIENNTSSDIANDNTSFDGVVMVKGEGKVHRNYHIFSDVDTIDGFQIPFPKITNPDVTNISLSFALFDSLSLRRAFNIDDSDEPKQDKYNDGNETYVNDRIFSDHTLNFSTYPSNKDLEYTIGGTQSTNSDAAFLEPLGTSIRLNEFDPLSKGVSSMMFAGWAELNVGYNKDEAEKILSRGGTIKEYLSNVAFPDGQAYKLLRLGDTSLVKGDLINTGGVTIYTRHRLFSGAAATWEYNQSYRFFIVVPFTSDIPKDKYTVFLNKPDGGIEFHAWHNTTEHAQKVTKEDSHFIIEIDEEIKVTRRLQSNTKERMIDGGGIKFKFGILVDLD